MRDPNRIPAIQAKLLEAWTMCPDMRLGQFVSNLIGSDEILFMIEDDRLESLLDDFLADPPYEEQTLMGETVYVPRGKDVRVEMLRETKGLLARLESEREEIDPLDPRTDDPESPEQG
jgi:hypothetical protein